MTMKTTMLQVDGIRCPKCEEKIKKALVRLNGIKSTETDRAAGTVSVVHEEPEADINAIVAAIEAIDDHKFSVKSIISAD